MATGGISPLAPLGGWASRNQGFGGSGSGSSAALSQGFKFPKPPEGLTPLQQLELYHLATKDKKSALGTIVDGAKHTVEGILNVISRPGWAVSSGLSEATKDGGFDIGGFADGAESGIKGETRRGMGENFKQWGILENHNTLRGIAGFGADVVTDPSMLLSVAAAPLTGGLSLSAIAAKETAMGLSKGSLKKAILTVDSGAAKAADLKAAAATFKKAGPGFETRAALALKQYDREVMTQGGKHLDRFDAASQHQLHMLQAAAHTEAGLAGSTKTLAVRYKIPFLKAGDGKYLHKGHLMLPTPVKAPSLIRVADGKGIITKLPLAAAAAEKVGQAFKADWRNEQFHALQSVAKRTTEQLDTQYKKQLADTMKGFTDLDQKDMWKALHFGETTPGIVRGISRTLDPRVLSKAVKDGVLTDKQAGFLGAWHNSTEYLRKQDKAFGREYKHRTGDGLAGDADGVIYVPHAYTTTGAAPRVAGKGILNVPGYEMARLGQAKGTPERMLGLLEQGHYKGVITTDPLETLLHRASRSAQAQANRLLSDTVAASHGVPAKLPDAEQLAKLTAKLERTEARLDGIESLGKEGQDALRARIALEHAEEHTARLEKAALGHAARKAVLKKELASLRGTLTKAQKKPRASADMLLGLKTKLWDELMASAPKSRKKHYEKLDTFRKAHRDGQALVRLARYYGDTKLAKLTPVTGAKVHGTQHKALAHELYAKAQSLLTPEAKKMMKDTWLTPPIKPRDSWAKRLEGLANDLKATGLQNQSVARKGLRSYLDSASAGAIKRPPGHIKAHIKTKERQIEAHDAKWAAAVERVNERSARSLSLKNSAADEQIVREQKYGEALLRSHADTLKKMEHHMTSVKNPAATAEGMRVVSRLRTADGTSAIALPNQLADGLERAARALEDDQFLRDFQKTWVRLVSKWKVAVTVVNPGYRTRNTMSDMWNMYIDDVPLWGMAKYGTKAAQYIMRDLKTGTPAQRLEAATIMREAYDHAILSGQFGGDIAKVMAYIKGTRSTKDLVQEKKFISAYTHMMTEFNKNAENWGRLTHYLYARQHLKMSPGAAAEKVRTAHFDYEALTPFEQKLKANIAPFYTWSRKNMPYQLKQMLSRPGRYSTFTKLQQESEAASGDDGNMLVPNWLKHNHAFRVPFGGKGNMLSPPFGPSDLQKIQHPKEMLNMLSPLVKVPLELAANNNLNTGQAIYGDSLAHPRAPVSDFAAKLLSVVPGSDVGQTSRSVNGEAVTGAGANPVVSYLASQTPLTNLVVTGMSDIKRASRGGSTPALLGEFGGISTFRPDQEAMAAAKAQEQQESFQQYLRGLRDQGIIAPSDRKKSKFDMTRDELILAQQGQ